LRHTILNGDVIACLRSLPDACVQCVVTSPPYWGLRDYGVEGQIGLEPTPEEHVEKMVEVFREVKRVLRDDGTLWLNYGDCYAGSTTGADRPPEPGHTHEDSGRVKTGQENKHRRPDAGLKPKDLVGMPWRIAFALQADGWYLRSDIIWSKPNPMPESVTDRPTKSHEYVFLLTKSSRYFYDADAIKEPYAESTFKRAKSVNNAAARKDNGTAINQRGLTAEQQTKAYSKVTETGGRNKRSVWHIATQSFSEAHFATFPEALVEPCIKAGTSERGACPECGAPWRRVVEKGGDDRGEMARALERSRAGASPFVIRDLQRVLPARYRMATLLHMWHRGNRAVRRARPLRWVRDRRKGGTGSRALLYPDRDQPRIRADRKETAPHRGTTRFRSL
jgi:DNA modification methylase